jgi:hypothetical protein
MTLLAGYDRGLLPHGDYVKIGGKNEDNENG